MALATPGRADRPPVYPRPLAGRCGALRGQSLENTVSTMHVAFTITGVLALTISIFIIFNSFSISLNQRWKDIAVLRAIGVESGNVRRMFLVEAIIPLGGLVVRYRGFLERSDAILRPSRG